MSVSVRKPTSELSIPGGSFVPDSVTVVYAVDNFPYAKVSMHEKLSGGNAVKMVRAVEAAGPAADMQTAMFQARFEPDSSVEVFDGTNRLVFDGFASDPKANMTAGSVGNTLTIGHESSILNALRLNPLPQLKNDWRDKVSSLKGDLAKRISDLTKYIVENYKSNPTQYLIGAGGDPLILAQIQGTNDRVLPLWYKVLENSSEWVGWPEITSPPYEGEQIPQFDSSINSAILNILKSGSDGFMGTIRSLTSNFQQMYVPLKEQGEYGELINWANIFENRKGRELPTINFTQSDFSGGSPRILPVSNVILETNVVNTHRDNPVPGVGNVSSVKNVAMWPPTFSGGSIIYKPAPSWFPTVIGVTHNKEPDEVNHKIEDYLVSIGKVAKLNRKIDSNGLRKIAERYARNYYSYASLLNATAKVSIPMDLSIDVGDFYELKTEEGIIGKGFLQRATHHMYTGGNKASSATTDLLFSHVEFTGFELPNK